MGQATRRVKIYYKIVNNGDGTSIANFYVKKELAEWMDEQFGEWFCKTTGSLYIIVPDKLEIEIPDIKNEWNCIFDMIENNVDDSIIKKFIKKFFPLGLPQVKAIRGKKKNNDYYYNEIFVNGIKIEEVIRHKKESGQRFANIINRFAR